MHDFLHLKPHFFQEIDIMLRAKSWLASCTALNGFWLGRETAARQTVELTAVSGALTFAQEDIRVLEQKNAEKEHYLLQLQIANRQLSDALQRPVKAQKSLTSGGTSVVFGE